jgi:hypothetical protein
MVQAPPRTTGTPPQAQKSAPPVVLPFQIAARRKSSLGFTTNAAVMSTSGALANIGPQPLPATGYLRYVELLVVGTTSGNAATVVFAPDAPWNAIGFFALSNAAGDNIIVPVDGYLIMLMNKYCALSEDPPYCDPRQSPITSQTAGVGAGLGGSFQFSLRIPLEIDPETAFGSVPSMASNKSLQMLIQVNPTSVVYTTPPTTPPTVQVTAIQDYWAQPNADNGRGTAQANVPQGNNSVQTWRFDTPGISAGDKNYKFANVGNVLRSFIFVYRNASNARSESVVPPIHYFNLNNDQMYYKPDSTWKDDMAVAYGYTTAGFDAANTLDTGVRAFHYFMASDGKVRCSSPRSQYLPTLDTTTLSYRGTFGSGMTTLQVLTDEIKPTSAPALYQNT